MYIYIHSLLYILELPLDKIIESVEKYEKKINF